MHWRSATFADADGLAGAAADVAGGLMCRVVGIPCRDVRFVSVRDWMDEPEGQVEAHVVDTRV